MDANVNAKKYPEGFYSALYPYYQSRPYFIPGEQIKYTELLEKNWTIFRDEFFEYYNKGLTKNDVMRTGRGYTQNGLKTITLLTNLYRYHKRCDHFPKTLKILEALPETILVSINVLSGNTDIKPHYGESDSTYRCHLGLVIPAGLPDCGIRVGNEFKAWQEGKLLAFIDANRHKVWNHTSADRVILMVDFMRPDIQRNKWIVCGRGWASAIMNAFVIKFPRLKKTPFALAVWINKLLGMLILSGILLQRNLKFEVPFISRN